MDYLSIVDVVERRRASQQAFERFKCNPIVILYNYKLLGPSLVKELNRQEVINHETGVYIPTVPVTSQ